MLKENREISTSNLHETVGNKNHHKVYYLQPFDGWSGIAWVCDIVYLYHAL